MLYRRPPVGYRRTSSEAEPETMINLAQQHVFNPGYGVDRNYWKGHFVRELPDELIDELLERMVASGRLMNWWDCCSAVRSKWRR